MHDWYSCFKSATKFVEDKPHSGRPSPSVNAKTVSKSGGARACQPVDDHQWGSEWSLYTVLFSTGNYEWRNELQMSWVSARFVHLLLTGDQRERQKQHVLWRQWQHSNSIWRHWLAGDLTLNIYRYSSLQTVPRTTQLQTIPQTTAAEYCVTIFARTYKCQSLSLHHAFCSLTFWRLMSTIKVVPHR